MARRHVLVGLLRARQALLQQHNPHGSPPALSGAPLDSSLLTIQRLVHACRQLLVPNTQFTHRPGQDTSATQSETRSSYISSSNTSSWPPQRGFGTVLTATQNAQGPDEIVKVLSSKAGGCDNQELVMALKRVMDMMQPPGRHKGLAWRNMPVAAEQRQARDAAAWLLGKLESRIFSLSVEQAALVISSIASSLGSIPPSSHLLSSLLQHLSARNFELLRSDSPPQHVLSTSARLALMRHLCLIGSHRTSSLQHDHGVLAALLHDAMHTCQSATDGVAVLQLIVRAPPRWIPTSEARRLSYGLVSRLMALLPTWSAKTSSDMLVCMSRLNLQEDPAALVYAVAHAHLCAQQGSLSTLSASSVIHSLGSFNKQNVAFAGALCRPELHALAERAKSEVAACLAARDDAHDPQHAQHTNWVWPRPGVDQALEAALCKTTRTQVLSRAGPDDGPTRVTPVLNVLPGQPGEPLHWQDAALDVTSFAEPTPQPLPASKLQVLRDMPSLQSHPSAMVQMLLDVCRYLADHSTGHSHREVSAALHGLGQLRLISGPLLAAAYQMLDGLKVHANHISITMSATSLANLHAVGTAGPAVVALADALPSATSELLAKDQLFALCNTCWALSLTDQPGTPAWRQYVYHHLLALHKQGWHTLQPVQARQLVAYLEVLRELEWEAARAAGLPGCPPVVWSKVPASLRNGLLPWHEEWIRAAEGSMSRDMHTHNARSMLSAFHSGVRSCLARLTEMCAGAWLPPQFEALTDDGLTRVDVLLTSACGRVRLAVEADGPWHFALNDPGLMMGSTARRMRALARRGYQQLSVPYWDWADLSFWPEKVTYIQGRLREFLTGLLQDDPELVQRLVGPTVQVKQVQDVAIKSLCDEQPTGGVILAERQRLARQLRAAAEMLCRVDTPVMQHVLGQSEGSPAGKQVNSNLTALVGVLKEVATQVEAGNSTQRESLHSIPRLKAIPVPRHVPGSSHMHPALRQRCLDLQTHYEGLRLGLAFVQKLKLVLIQVKQARIDLNEDIFLRGGQATHHAANQAADSFAWSSPHQQADGAPGRHQAGTPSHAEAPGGAGRFRQHHQLADLEDAIGRVLRMENLIRARYFLAKNLLEGKSSEGLLQRSEAQPQDISMSTSEAGQVHRTERNEDVLDDVGEVGGLTVEEIGRQQVRDGGRESQSCIDSTTDVDNQRPVPPPLMPRPRSSNASRRLSGAERSGQ